MPPISRLRFNLFTLVFAGLVSCVLSACNGSARHDQSAQEVQYPFGIGGSDVRGIYPGGNGEACCWTAPEVRFTVPADQAATLILLDVYEPKLGEFVHAQQVVSLVGGSGKVLATRTVPTGIPTTISFPLSPADVRDGVAAIHLRMATSYVPKEIGLGGDLRRLALIVKRVSVR